MIKSPVAILIIILVLFGGGVAVGYLGANYWSSKAIAREEQRYSLAMQHVARRTVERGKQLEKTKFILRKIKDPTGCLDTDQPDTFTQQLRSHFARN